MTKEEKYTADLKALGLWHPAFAATVHDLCILERELSRTRAAWKKTAKPGETPSTLDKHYAVICRQTQDILALRESLGLTPKSLRRIKGAQALPDERTKTQTATILDLVRGKYA